MIALLSCQPKRLLIARHPVIARYPVIARHPVADMSRESCKYSLH